ncbi:sterol regulatory element-binding protein cleavage-activating protein [Aplysia californica]|uniref:Sterol regulatory element-binding protein cleavage-activating protein n=1 Tax=Aplysia californica TaxID=6500 RepID=A0ABM1ACK9_APLCA|nr:sterol regulatory element-binding protein cleavage-activating protein [Aplysia californica]
MSGMPNIKSVHDRVAQIYYTYGLFCASHQYATIVLVIISVFITCYPLSTLPLSGNTPIQHRTPKVGYTVPPQTFAPSKDGSQEDLKRPRWFVGEPVAYIQQIVVKAAVSPWPEREMVVSDAFRAPLATVFSIEEELNNLKVGKGSSERSLADLCYRVSEPVSARHLRHLLPEYSCFILSPANLWNHDFDRFRKDGELIRTIYKQHGKIESSPTSRDLLFGVPWKFSGITRYYFRNRQRVITYAVTIILKKYDPNFLSQLLRKLESRHPDTVQNVNNSQIEDMVHVHFKDSNYFVEYTPLLVTYFVLLLYLYFSVRKIDMVKSKLGLAISAVVTVVASLIMSVSICTLFGLTPTLNGGEIFPYLVVIIGVENVLVITKSVVSTPVHLDVKIRVAQGLSREGWYITKNLLTELAIMFVGFFTFVPAIQEFCAFALVGVLSDFYLQMAFFATVLSVDIRRMELSDLHRQSVQRAVQDDTSSPPINIQPLVLCPFVPRQASPSPRLLSSTPVDRSGSGFPSTSGRSLSAQRTPSPSPQREGDQQAFFGHSHQSQQERPRYEMPRRVKFFYFLARFRIVQKLIMVCTVIWIILILHKTGLVDKLTGTDEQSSLPRHVVFRQGAAYSGVSVDMGSMRPEEEGHMGSALREDDLATGPVEHSNLEMWKLLSFNHWPGLFHYYNISLSGRYISILPSIHLSHLIPPSTAISMRHQSDRKTVDMQREHQETGTGPLPHDMLQFSSHVSYHEDPHPDLSDSSSENDSHGKRSHLPPHNYPFYPKSQREFVITIVLCVLSVIVITYFMMYLYRCMCSRNYSRWRHSWTRANRRRSRGYIKQIKESVPLVLSGHSQNIECLLGDNGLIVSCCLGGHLKIWDSNSGDCINTIIRRSITPPAHRRPCVGRNIEDSDADLYAEYHGSRSSSESSLLGDASGDGVRVRKGNSFTLHTGSTHGRRSSRRRKSSRESQDVKPDLSSTINTEFSSMDGPLVQSSPNGFDFQTLFEGVYEEHRRYLQEEGNDLRVHSSNDLTLLSSYDERSRSWSYGDQSSFEAAVHEEDLEQSSPVWCLACLHGLVVTGCGNGRVEVWEAETGELRYCYAISQVPVTGLCVVSNKIVAARIDGTLDFLEMETFHNPVANPAPRSPQPGRPVMGHHRSRSSSSDGIKMWDEVIRCSGVNTVRAHQQPINAVQCAGGRIVTASQDHTLKVFRLDSSLCLYTLHGHEDSVTALCLDQVAPLAAVSGSFDGTVRIWDLLTGTCIHKLSWHYAAVVTLSTSPLYIVSVGLDDRMCVWDRTKNTLLHTVDLDQNGVGSAALLSRNLMVTGGQGSISLWDIPRGSLLRKVVFSDSDQRAFVNHVVSVGNSGVVCDQGSDLKVVYFPTILEKAE